MVTDAQVQRLQAKRMEGKTVSAAAAAAGMGERTAHRWQRGALPSAAKAPRTWRTREDPCADVWLSEVAPQLVADAAGRLQALTLFAWLCEQHPGRFAPGQRRTLQRRVRAWRAQHGPDHEVYFEQVAVPCREAAFDVTDASALGVTIRGVPFPHLLFEWVLSYSGWTYVALALRETFEALVAGVQGALWTLGAAPAVLRHVGQEVVGAREAKGFEGGAQRPLASPMYAHWVSWLMTPNGPVLAVSGPLIRVPDLLSGSLLFVPRILVARLDFLVRRCARRCLSRARSPSHA